jgi:4-amino-4-deoxy-L-arabinose transferase-like glycosyltransferase
MVHCLNAGTPKNGGFATDYGLRTTDYGLRTHPLLPCVGLLLFCGLLFFPGLGERDLTSSHEARAAQNAQMILDEGHWLIPRLFDRHLEMQKPPLYYWLVALIAWMKGGDVDAWAVRLPAALSAFACVLFLYLVGVQSKRPLAGLLAALILASCLHFTWLARVGRIDMPLTLTITLALCAFHLGNRDDSTWKQKGVWHAFGYTSLGLGVLLKGPIALALPAVVAGAPWSLRTFCGIGFRSSHPDAKYDAASGSHAPAWERRVPTPERGNQSGWIGFLSHVVRTTSLWWGIPWMLAIAAPWYIWANLRTDNQLWEIFFWYHNVERALGGSEVLKSHPWWFYVPQMFYDMLPWSLAVPGAIYWCYRNRENRKDDAACLGMIWFGAIGLFLSCVSFKRADYLLPAYPGMAIFLGACAERWWRQRFRPEAQAKTESESLACAAGSERSCKLVCACFLTILFVYAVGWYVYNIWFIPANEKAWPYRTMAQEIRRHTQGPVIFFRAESHPLMYHLGRPVDTILEWENLEWWVNRPMPIYIVMPKGSACKWRDHLGSGSLEEVLHTIDYVNGKRDRPLVVLRSRGKPAANP